MKADFILASKIIMKIYPFQSPSSSHKFSLTFFSEALCLRTFNAAFGCWSTVKVMLPGFMIPAFCQAISSIVLPSKLVWSMPSDVIPTVETCLEARKQF